MNQMHQIIPLNLVRQRCDKADRTVFSTAQVTCELFPKDSSSDLASSSHSRPGTSLSVSLIENSRAFSWSCSESQWPKFPCLPISQNYLGLIALLHRVWLTRNCRKIKAKFNYLIDSHGIFHVYGTKIRCKGLQFM